MVVVVVVLQQLFHLLLDRTDDPSVSRRHSETGQSCAHDQQRHRHHSAVLLCGAENDHSRCSSPGAIWTVRASNAMTTDDARIQDATALERAAMIVCFVRDGTVAALYSITMSSLPSSSSLGSEEDVMAAVD